MTGGKAYFATPGNLTQFVLIDFPRRKKSRVRQRRASRSFDGEPRLSRPVINTPPRRFSLMTETYFAASCNLKRFAFVYLFKRGKGFGRLGGRGAAATFGGVVA